jgi:penicillin-binding protein 2
MSFHPNDVARRGRIAALALVGGFVLLTGAFFRTQVLQNTEYKLQSEQNRFREIPLPAPRGIIYDRNNQIIAENLPGYSVSILAPSADSLRVALARLGEIIQLRNEQIESAVRRFRRAPNRPTVVLGDASFDEISVLEEHRVQFPGLIIQSAPKRYYPDGPAVASFIGYTGEISESELSSPAYKGYKSGQQIGRGGLEKAYETALRGEEGTHFVEVDARGRVVREKDDRDVPPKAAPALRTNIDMDLQRYAVSLFGDSLQGGVVAIEPKTGAVLALHSAPTFDPNRFIGGIPADYWNELNTDPRKPLYNKAIQGRYPPGSTWKLATAAWAMQNKIVGLNDRMPVSCTGGFQYGSRYFKCWEKRGHGNVDLSRAIEVSCDVYFYQLGLRMGLARLLAGGVALDFNQRTGIDLPDEARSRFPDAPRYFDERYGKRGWTNAVILNLSIGQGENDQTVLNMARFYTALATDGQASKPQIAQVESGPVHERLMTLTDKDMQGLRDAMAGVVSARGTAGSAAIKGVILAGKTGTAQNSSLSGDHAWFVGFAPAEDPKIVVAVMIEFGGHGYRAARIASKVIEKHLKTTPIQLIQTDG